MKVVKFTEPELGALVRLLDAAVRGLGGQSAPAFVQLMARINAATDDTPIERTSSDES